MTWDLRLGDCLDPVTGLASLADKSVDHVITDPPYEAEAHTLQRRVKREGGVMEIEALTFDPIGEEERTGVGLQAGRLSRRWSLVFCQAEAITAWKDSLARGGAVYRRACIWVKPDGMPQYSGDRPGMGHESIVAAHAEGKSRWNGGGQHGVWIVNKNENGAGNEHPTQKPVALMEKLVRLFTDPGDLILDPFAGSGTTIFIATVHHDGKVPDGTVTFTGREAEFGSVFGHSGAFYFDDTNGVVSTAGNVSGEFTSDGGILGFEKLHAAGQFFPTPSPSVNGNLSHTVDYSVKVSFGGPSAQSLVASLDLVTLWKR